ncbi:MAG: hypothetical protein JW861_05000 [Bacteroidales bacterium]|nr:hypothetical protein [Bacteroidales bacterium]
MKKMMMPLVAGFILIFIGACQVEEEVYIEPGQVEVNNVSNLNFEIYVTDLDRAPGIEVYKGIIHENQQILLELELGYSFRIKALNPESPDPQVYEKTFLINPHVELSWSIPNGHLITQ